MGRALQGVGAQLAEMAQKEQEADDARLMIDFEGEMRKAVDEQSVFQQQVQEQSEWLPKWQWRAGELQKRLDGLKVSDKTRLNLTQSFGQFADRHTLNIRGQAFEQSQTRAKLTFENRLNQAVMSGNADEVGQTIRIAKQSGVGLPEQWDAAELSAQEKVKGVQIERANTAAETALANNDVETARAVIESSPMPEDEKKLALARLASGAARKKEYDSLLVIANDDPDRALELAPMQEKSGKITGLDRLNIEREAMQSKAFKRRDSVTKYKEGLALGIVPSVEELKADTTLNDYDRATVADLATGKVNDPAEFESALTAAMTFDPSQFDDEREAVTAATNMEAAFNLRFEGPHLSNLKAELDKRRQRSADAATEATDLGPALKMLDEEIERGGLGPITKPVMQDGKPLMRDPKKEGFIQKPGWLWGTNKKDVQENDGKPVPITEPDAVAREKAAAAQRDIRRILDSEVKAGKLKDQAAITARTIELFKTKGGKIAPMMPTTGPNPLLPAIDAPKTDLDALLKKYGH